MVSVLTGAPCTDVQALWNDLDREFGIAAAFMTPVPHISYHVAVGYNLALLAALLDEMARELGPFMTRTAGLGIFTTPKPILYLPVIRNPALDNLHAALFHKIAPLAEQPSTFYTPEHWQPHVTLVAGESEPGLLGEITSYLSRRQLIWELEIDNLAVICDRCGEQGLYHRVGLDPNLSLRTEDPLCI